MPDSKNTLTRAKLLNEIETNWNELQTYLSDLTEAQLIQPTDAEGWTVKDHVIHIAMWDNAALALLEGKSKRAVMNIDPAIWAKDDDARSINAVLHKRYQPMSLVEVMQIFRENHERLVQKLHTLIEEDLQLPYNYYQSDSPDEHPLIESFIWETAYHYREHIPWITAIVENG